MSVNKEGIESRLTSLLKRVFFIDLLKGLSLTLKYNLSRSFTMRYPDEEKWIPYERFRGRHTLNRDAHGRELCVGCELCARSCPTQCITVIPMEDEMGKGIADRVSKVWEVNLTRCMFCGLCEDACPTEALKLGRDYELACFSLPSAVKGKEELLRPREIPPEYEGGVVVKAGLERDGETVWVRPDLSRRKRWW